MRHCKDGINRPDIRQVGVIPAQRYLGKQGDKKAREKRITKYPNPKKFMKYIPKHAEFDIQQFMQSLT